MKHDLSGKLSRPARRALDAFSHAFFALVTRKPLQELSTSELCEEADYPRATFYNYFADKYDLATACWQMMGREIGFGRRDELAPGEALGIMFDRAYDLLTQNRKLLLGVLEHNPLGSPLVASFESYVRSCLAEAFETYPVAHEAPVPDPVLARHYADTVLLVLEWALLDGGSAPVERARAHEAVCWLLGEPKQPKADETQTWREGRRT